MSVRVARLAPFGSPSDGLQATVVVPARNEEASLPALVAALEDVRRPGSWGRDALEVLVLLNNCTDGSERVARELATSRTWLRVAHVDLPAEHAHVGRARQILFDTAAARLLEVGRPDGLILSTDADSRPARDWLAETVLEVEAGADAVFGRIGLV
ncbi:glycosyltransferase, partial [Rubrivirga sp.]|uniref:glycosyltransferase n=1 Tax=Rubrivirga sp. TaxID=1885344 RepID=UPI003C772107